MKPGPPAHLARTKTAAANIPATGANGQIPFPYTDISVLMVADGSGRHYACSLILRLINASQQQPPSAASMTSIKWSHVLVTANEVNFYTLQMAVKQICSSTWNAPSNQYHTMITWLRNFPWVATRGGKTAFNCRALKNAECVSRWMLYCLCATETCKKEQLVETCRHFQRCYKYESLIISLLKKQSL